MSSVSLSSVKPETDHGGSQPPPAVLSTKLAPRRITRTLKVHEASEGIGSKVRRCIGNRDVRCLPPFVICEHFKMDKRGRPPHPARGAQKITYVMKGQVKIEYSSSNSLELGPGDVTSLMVGKGVIRSVQAMENEEQKQQAGYVPGKASASGLQIYMDVPEPFKRIEPSHLNLCHSDIVNCHPSDGVSVRILTGSAFGKKADQMLTTTPALILDFLLEPGATVELPVKSDWNAFAYVTKGQAHVQGEKVMKHQYVEFMRSPRNSGSQSNRPTPPAGQQTSGQQTTGQQTTANSQRQQAAKRPHDDAGDASEDAGVTFSVDVAAKSPARLLFCAAKPLCQPIYRQGPFVDVSMNWIHQAFDDYSERKNGFETGQWWNSPRPVSGDLLIPGANPGMQKPSWASNCGPDETSTAGDDASDGPVYNPCESEECSDGTCSECDSKRERTRKGKASFPNSFPPGKVNPASHSTEFNSVDCVEQQQEDKVPQRKKPSSGSTKRRRLSESSENDGSDATSGIESPPAKT